MTLVLNVVQDVVRDEVDSTIGSNEKQQIIDLFEGGQKGGFWDAFDASLRFQESTGPGVTPAISGDRIGYFKDLSPNGAHFDSTIDDQRPLLTFSGGIWSIDYDDVDDELECAFTSSVNMRFYLARKAPASDDAGILFNNHVDNSWAGGYQSGSASASKLNAGGSVTQYVNNSLISPDTRGDMFTAINDDTWKIVEARDVDCSVWAQFGIGTFAGSFHIGGSIGTCILLPESIASANHALLYNYIAAQYGLQKIQT